MRGASSSSQPHLAHEVALGFCGKPNLAPCRRGHGIADLVTIGVLAEKRRGALSDALVDGFRRRVRRQQDDGGRKLVALDRVEHLQPVEPRHLEIEQGDVRPQRADLLQGGAPVLGLPDELELGDAG